MRIDVPKRLIIIQNFLLPYLVRLNFSTIGAKDSVIITCDIFEAERQCNKRESAQNIRRWKSWINIDYHPNHRKINSLHKVYVANKELNK